MIIISSEIFNPYPFVVLGIDRPDSTLFISITDNIISQRDILVPDYDEGLEAVIKLLSKAAPLTDLYLYLRDHPLQNPVKAKVHCEHGFGSLRFAVRAYLDVSFLLIVSLDICVHPLFMAQEMSTSCSESSSKVIFSHP